MTLGSTVGYFLWDLLSLSSLLDRRQRTVQPVDTLSAGYVGCWRNGRSLFRFAASTGRKGADSERQSFVRRFPFDSPR